MRCTRCKADCRYKERPDRKCPRCGQSFVFEPMAGDKITDVGFQNAIDAVSSGGKVRFLPDHVYYELARRKRRTGLASGVVLAVGAISIPIGFLSPAAFLVTGVCGLLGMAAWPSKTITFGRGDFEELWKRWVAERGAPQGLIVRRERHEPYRGPVDIPSYSFDRAVVCDRASTVDVLLANNFHFENNCAVLSVDGYPPHAFDTVRAMLKNNPKLTVYALHAADPDGCRLAHKLASDPAWFRGKRVVEVGLRPAHARKLSGVWLPASEPLKATDPFNADERKWLSAYQLELAAIRPEQVIKRLFACITNDQKLIRAEDAGVAVESDAGYWVDPWTFGSDASASDGGDDAFG